MPAPGNVVKNEFSGNAGVYSPVPIVNNAAALVFYLDNPKPKRLLSVAYSIGMNPFVAAGGYNSQLAANATLNNEVFGRLTVFRNFSQNPLSLFDPYFGSDFVTAGPPFASDFYGPRVDYNLDDMIFDMVITRIGGNIFSVEANFNSTDKLTIVLSPFYKAVQSGSAAQTFGSYMGDELSRTLSVNGCFAYGIS